MNKQKKIIIISIVAVSIVLIVAIICVTTSLLKDKNSHNKKDDTTKKETTELVENITTEERTTEDPTTEDSTKQPVIQIPIEETMTFSVVDGVLYQSNSKKIEAVESGLSYYTLSPNEKAILYRSEDGGNQYIRVEGQDRVEIDLGSEYGGSLLRLYDTGEAYFLGETIYTDDIYWCRTPIYYFDGKELKVVTDRAPCGQMSSTPTTLVADNAPVIMFEQLKSLDTGEVDYIVLAIRDEIQEIDLSDAGYIWGGGYEIHDYGKKIWYTKYENNSIHLYEINNKFGKFEDPKLIDSDLESICVDRVNLFNDIIEPYKDDMYYFKNSTILYEPTANNGNNENVGLIVVDSADMFISGKLIDRNVYAQSVRNKNDALYYYTDYDVEEWAGVLKKYSDGNVETLAIGVTGFTFLDNGDLEISYLNGEVTTISF